MAKAPYRVKTAVALVACLISLANVAPARDFEIHEIAPGVYYGPIPKTDSDFRQLQGLGVKTVVELRKFMHRKSAREEGLVSAYGMVHRLVPMGFEPSRDGTPELALEIMHDPAQQPVYVHCMLGRDRTGVVVALYRVRYLGWSPEAAYAEFEAELFNPLLFGLKRYFWRYARVSGATPADTRKLQEPSEKRD